VRAASHFIHAKEQTMMPRIAVWCLAGLLISAPALAADLKIGYVDVRAVLTESQAGKQHRADLEKYIKDKQAGFKKEEDKLNALKQSFEKEQLTLTDAQKQEKQKAFQEKVQAFQKTAQEADHELRQKDADFNKKAVEEVRKLVAELAKEEKLSLVLALPRDGVFYAEEGIDITPKVIQKFDSQSGKNKKK
jgi:outer membrane protein